MATAVVKVSGDPVKTALSNVAPVLPVIDEPYAVIAVGDAGVVIVMVAESLMVPFCQNKLQLNW